MAKRLVSDLDVKGKKVIVRVDFNVPHKGEVITDDNRIVSTITTELAILAIILSNRCQGMKISIIPNANTGKTYLNIEQI